MRAHSCSQSYLQLWFDPNINFSQSFCFTFLSLSLFHPLFCTLSVFLAKSSVSPHFSCYLLPLLLFFVVVHISFPFCPPVRVVCSAQTERLSFSTNTIRSAVYCIYICIRLCIVCLYLLDCRSSIWFCSRIHQIFWLCGRWTHTEKPIKHFLLIFFRFSVMDYDNANMFFVELFPKMSFTEIPSTMQFFLSQSGSKKKMWLVR